MEIMIFFLVPAAIFDLRLRRIPNVLTALMLVCCIFRSLFFFGFREVLISVFWVIGTGLLLYPVFAIGALGAGDVKLMAVCSGFLPGTRVFYFLFFSFLTGTLFGLVRIVRKKEMAHRLRTLTLYIEKFLRTGTPERYHCSREAAGKAGVALAAPMLISALMGLGGIY